MCVSALPWMFLPIWSMAKESPPAGALSPVCVILCRAGSGLSAVTRYSMGPPGHRPAQLQLANRGEHGRGREVSQRPRRPGPAAAGFPLCHPACVKGAAGNDKPADWEAADDGGQVRAVEREPDPVPNGPGDSPISAARIAAAGESGVQQQDAHVNG